MARMDDDEEEHIPRGMVKCVDLHTRQPVYVFANKVAAVAQITEDIAPTRLVFDGGGSIEVCGTTTVWNYHIQIARLKNP